MWPNSPQNIEAQTIWNKISQSHYTMVKITSFQEYIDFLKSDMKWDHIRKKLRSTNTDLLWADSEQAPIIVDRPFWKKDPF